MASPAPILRHHNNETANTNTAVSTSEPTLDGNSDDDIPIASLRAVRDDDISDGADSTAGDVPGVGDVVSILSAYHYHRRLSSGASASASLGQGDYSTINRM